LPLPIKLNGTNGEVAYLALTNDQNNQYFTVNTSFPISSVEFNYEYQILENNSTVQMDSNLSTLEKNNNSEVEIYPNPVWNEIHLKGLKKTMDYTIYFINGQYIKSGKIKPNETIDVNELNVGTYILELNGMQYKFIKK
jgi:hypothetical protein